MPKIQTLILFTITLTLLFASLALPSLTGEAKALLLTRDETQSISLLSTSNQITFTEVTTIFLPYIEKPFMPENSLEIVALVYDAQDEYITVKNNGPQSQLMDGWQIISQVGTQTYNFPKGIVLEVGQRLRVHSGPAALNNPPGDLFWTTAYMWNTVGDMAELRDDKGTLQALHCYLVGCPK